MHHCKTASIGVQRSNNRGWPHEAPSIGSWPELSGITVETIPAGMTEGQLGQMRVVLRPWVPAPGCKQWSNLGNLSPSLAKVFYKQLGYCSCLCRTAVKHWNVIQHWNAPTPIPLFLDNMLNDAQFQRRFERKTSPRIMEAKIPGNQYPGIHSTSYLVPFHAFLKNNSSLSRSFLDAFYFLFWSVCTTLRSGRYGLHWIVTQAS